MVSGNQLKSFQRYLFSRLKTNDEFCNNGCPFLIKVINKKYCLLFGKNVVNTKKGVKRHEMCLRYLGLYYGR